MSLTAILKQIKKVDQKHRAIIQRYNSAKKQCQRHNQLLKEEQEDERIFGYSGSQILGLFKSANKENLDETRPCTAFARNTQTVQRQSRQLRLSDHEKRTKTAAKPVRYQEQFNFLFKEDIFGQNHQNNNPFSHQIKKAELKLAKKLTKQGVPFRLRQQHLQSLQEEKTNFIEQFQNNLELMQNRGEAPMKKSTTKMTYDKKENLPNKKTFQTTKKREDLEDLFKLTRATVETCDKKMKLVFSSSFPNLKDIKPFMNIRQENTFLQLDSSNRDPIPFDYFEEELIGLLPPKFILTCVDLHSLQSLKLNLIVVNEQLLLADSKQKVDLKHFRNCLLSEHRFLHLCFHTKGELLYELFLSDSKLIHSQNIELQIDLVAYHLKRFLLFDGVASIQAVNESAELMIKSNVDLPDPFFQFIATFSKKMVHFLDKDRKYFTVCLKTAILSGLRGIQGFKKEMGFGDKVVKIKTGTRRDLKKYTCNWAYFYICSFNISNKNQYLWQQLIFSLLFSSIRSSLFLFSSTSLFRSSRVSFQ